MLAHATVNIGFTHHVVERFVHAKNHCMKCNSYGHKIMYCRGQAKSEYCRQTREPTTCQTTTIVEAQEVKRKKQELHTMYQQGEIAPTITSSHDPKRKVPSTGMPSTMMDDPPLWWVTHVGWKKMQPLCPRAA